MYRVKCEQSAGGGKDVSHTSLHCHDFLSNHLLFDQTFGVLPRESISFSPVPYSPMRLRSEDDQFDMKP